MRTLILLTVASLVLWGSNALAQTCNGQPATIIGTEDDDDIPGTPGDDIIVGLGGNDRITGLAGNDLICGGDGDDDLIGGDGDDQLFGDVGNDVLEGDIGVDACDGGTGVDSADEPCETVVNTDTMVFPVTLLADDGFPLPGALYVPTGDALINGQRRQVAMIVSHGAMGSFSFSVPKIIGLQAAPLGFTVLALDRRDAGPDAGGGAILFEDATLDIGVGIDLLAALGYDAVYVAGHSQGTQNASIYPSFSMDPRVVAVGLYGTVDDGRSVAQNLLFNEFAAPVPYSDYVVLAEDLVAAGEGDIVRPWDTLFGQPVFRSPNNWLSFWGPDSLSVPVREIKKLLVPALLLRADGDEFTPDAMSQNVRDSALEDGVDAIYTILPYPFPLTANGGNAHGFAGVERETIATTLDWLEDRVPEATETKPDIRMPMDDGTGNNFRPLAYENSSSRFLGADVSDLLLDGSRSRDIDGQIVSYLWTQVGGPAVVLDDPTSARPLLRLADGPPVAAASVAPVARLASLAAEPPNESASPPPILRSNGPAEQVLLQLTVTDDDGATDTITLAVAVAVDNVVAKLPGGSTVGPAALLALWLIGRARRRRV